MNEVVADYSLQPLSFHEAWTAGQVVRFHANRTQRKQSVGEHSFGVALLCMVLWPEKPLLVQKAILHDIPEVVTGDTPHPSKRILGLDPLREADVEARLLSDLPQYGPYSDEDETRLKIADMIDFVLFVQNEMSMGNSHAIPMFTRGSDLVLRRIDLLPELERGRIRSTFETMIEEASRYEGRYT